MEDIEMKRKKIKLLAGVMIIAMTGAVFIGCGKKGRCLRIPRDGYVVCQGNPGSSYI